MTRCVLTLRVIMNQPLQQKTCTHPERELIGWDHDLAFGRCKVCGQVLVRQRDMLWAIRPTDLESDPGASGRRSANDD
jgi:hypothetical protein